MRRENGTSSCLPSGYRQLEYIDGTGTQYINTGVCPTNKTYCYLDFQPLTITLVGCEVIGSWWTGSPNYMTYSFSDAASANYSLYVYAGNYRQNYFQLTPDNSSFLARRHIGEIDPINLICRIDSYSHSLANSTYTSNYPIFLFGFNNQGTAGLRGSLRIYECKFSEDGVPIRHYIPALRISDSKPGMYDIVNNQFYTNAGSGEFQYA